MRKKMRSGNKTTMVKLNEPVENTISYIASFAEPDLGDTSKLFFKK